MRFLFFIFIEVNFMRHFKKESDYQKYLIDKIGAMFPGCVIHKNAGYIQGFPDLTVFFAGGYAMLEVKISRDASHQPNQDWYIEHLNRMSFARFIYPENEEEVLNELFRFQQALK